MSRRGRRPAPSFPRWIDLRNAWPLQYAGETNDLAADDYPGMAGRLGQVDGYLGSVALAMVAVERSAADWARRAEDPWAALIRQAARIEAEFSGRLLIGPEDLALWRDDQKGGLTWGVLTVAGLAPWLREESDLDRLNALFERGVRGFRLRDRPGGPEGLTTLDAAALERLGGLGESGGARPIVDLGDLGPSALDAALDWLDEAPRSVVPILTDAAIGHDGIDGDRLARLRRLGVLLALAPDPSRWASADQFAEGVEAAAALPFGDEAAPGRSGLAIASGALLRDATLPGLEDAEAIAAWAVGRWGPATADRLLIENPRSAVLAAIGPG